MNFLSDKRFFYPGILVLAWIILTPLYSYPWHMFSLTGLLAALAGDWFAGERNAKSFLTGFAGALLLSVPFCISNAVNGGPVKTFFLTNLPRKFQLCGAASFIPDIPNGMTWYIVGIVILGAAIIYTVFFNCRLLLGNPYFSFGAGILCIAVLNFVSVWAYYGILPFFMFFASEEHLSVFIMYDNRILDGLIPTAAGFILLFACWTVLNLRRERTGGRKLLKDIGLTASGCAAVWLLAALTAYSYSHMAIEKSAQMFPSKKRSGIPQTLLDADKKHEEWLMAFYKDNPDFQLPGESPYDWGTGGTRPIPEKMRKTTLEIFQSTKGANFFRQNTEQIARYMEELPVRDPMKSLPTLNGWRAVARRSYSRAMLSAYLGREKEVLPALNECIGLEEAIEKNQETMIESLVLEAIRYMRFTGIVQFGPDSPEYAPFYRRELGKLIHSRIRIPNEAPLSAREIERTLRLQPYFLMPEESFYSRLLSFPFSAVLFSREAFAYMNHKDEIERLSDEPVIGKADSDFIGKNTVDFYRNAILRAAYTKSLFTAAMALKLYRCEKGHYPKTLHELVPEYLKQLPVDPVDGATLSYELLPEGSFRLFIPSNKTIGFKSKLEFHKENVK